MNGFGATVQSPGLTLDREVASIHHSKRLMRLANSYLKATGLHSHVLTVDDKTGTTPVAPTIGKCRRTTAH